MNIIGIDYSYTSPAVCILGDSFVNSRFYFCNAKKKHAVEARNYKGTLIEKGWRNDAERYEFLARTICQNIQPHVNAETKIIMEGYAFGASAGLSFNIAENGMMLKYHLWKCFGIYPEVVPPTMVKKFWTGKGNSKKEAMVETLKEKEGVDILEWLYMDKLDSPAHDIVDSYAIALAGAAGIHKDANRKLIK